MNLFEKTSIRLRHLPVLRHAGWLWSLVRPCYDLVVRWTSPRGIQRVINGTDEIRLLPELRGTVEEYEPEVWKQVMAALRPGANVVEAGAHVGLYAIAMARRVGPAGKVLAAEPDPANAAILRRHIALNGVTAQVEVVAAGLSDQPGQAVLHLQGIQSQLRSAEATDHGTTVSLTTIDAISGEKAIDLILVDVEGYELQVLRGADAVLRTPLRRPGTIVVEVHPYAWDACNASSAALLGLLGGHGYVVTDPAGRPVTEVTGYGHIIARHPEARR